MTVSSTIGLVAVAGVIGVTHAIEPDHVAGISAVTGGALDGRLAALVGACFALGHVLLVVAWLVLARWVLDVASLGPLVETVGITVVGVVLVGLGVALGVRAARRLVHAHEHHHGGRIHTHVHRHGVGTPEHHHAGGTHAQDAPHDHEHTLAEYLKIGVVGALFTLSPPISMVVFLTVVLANASTALVVPVVLAYAVAITLTMSLVGLGAGAVFRLAAGRGPRVHATLQLVVAGLVLVVAVALLGEQLPSAVGW